MSRVGSRGRHPKSNLKLRESNRLSDLFCSEENSKLWVSPHICCCHTKVFNKAPTRRKWASLVLRSTHSALKECSGGCWHTKMRPAEQTCQALYHNKIYTWNVVCACWKCPIIKMIWENKLKLKIAGLEFWIIKCKHISLLNYTCS